MIDETVAELEALFVSVAPASATVRKDRAQIPRDERASVLVSPASESPDEELETLSSEAVTEVVEVACVATSWDLLHALVGAVRQAVTGARSLGLRWTGTAYERQRGGDPPRFEAVLTYERHALSEL